MAKRARLSQDRSRIRSDALLDAAIELFAEGGSRAVTHRAVAQRAGLPAATTTYYFQSIEELLTEALAHYIDNWIAEFDKFAEMSFVETLDISSARSVIAAAFATWSPQVARTQISVYVAATLDPNLRAKAAAALSTVRRLATILLKSVGVEDHDGLGEALVHAMLGSAMARLSSESDDEHIAEVLFQTVRRLVAAWEMDDRQIARALPVAHVA